MTYTKEDIGKPVDVVIEGVVVQDVVIEMFLPNHTTIIGPSITCGHIFARFVMMPDMIRVSNEIKESMEDSA